MSKTAIGIAAVIGVGAAVGLTIAMGVKMQRRRHNINAAVRAFRTIDADIRRLKTIMLEVVAEAPPRTDQITAIGKDLVHQLRILDQLIHKVLPKEVKAAIDVLVQTLHDTSGVVGGQLAEWVKSLIQYIVDAHKRTTTPGGPHSTPWTPLKPQPPPAIVGPGGNPSHNVPPLPPADLPKADAAAQMFDLMNMVHQHLDRSVPAVRGSMKHKACKKCLSQVAPLYDRIRQQDHWGHHNSNYSLHDTNWGNSPNAHAPSMLGQMPLHGRSAAEQHHNHHQNVQYSLQDDTYADQAQPGDYNMMAPNRAELAYGQPGINAPPMANQGDRINQLGGMDMLTPGMYSQMPFSSNTGNLSISSYSAPWPYQGRIYDYLRDGDTNTGYRPGDDIGRQISYMD